MGNYDDIINMPYIKSAKHQPMSMHDRAAQFAPFKALTGYEDSIDEAAEIAESKRELNEIEKAELDITLKYLMDNIKSCPVVTVKYFVPNVGKPGGRYLTKTAPIRHIDNILNTITFVDDSVINIDDLIVIIKI